MPENRNFTPVTPDTYRINLPENVNFDFVSAHTIFPYEYGTDNASVTFTQVSDTYIQEVYRNDQKIFENQYTIIRTSIDQPKKDLIGKNIGYSERLVKNAIYKVIYSYSARPVFNSGNFDNKVQYIFQVVENKLPLKPQSITDVINRLFDVAEPINLGEFPRFKLNDAQAKLFDKIRSPEFSFTKQTLRECLQEIGKFIHGEPRITVKEGAVGYDYVKVGTEKFSDGKAYIGSNGTGGYDINTTYYVKVNNYYYAPLEIVSQADPSAPANDEYYLESIDVYGTDSEIKIQLFHNVFLDRF